MKPIRACANCGSDISDRGPLARRCISCAKSRQRQQLKEKQRTMYDRACERCGEAFRTRVKQGRFCGTRCAGLATRPEILDRVCVVCDKPFQISAQFDRNTCSRPCRRWAAENPGESPATECRRCGGPLGRKHKRAKFCSAACSVAVRAFVLGKSKLFHKPTSSCLICDKSLDGRPINTKYCSHACQALKGHERRSRKMSAAPVESVLPAEIFARDNWTCHLCDGFIDRTLRNKHPQMASLDHIIPVDDPNYPGHIWENLATAHLTCNVSKGPRATDRDWDLYQELARRRHGEAGWPQKRPALKRRRLLLV